jgi:hypothetical protein
MARGPPKRCAMKVDSVIVGRSETLYAPEDQSSRCRRVSSQPARCSIPEFTSAVTRCTSPDRSNWRAPRNTLHSNPSVSTLKSRTERRARPGKILSRGSTATLWTVHEPRHAATFCGRPGLAGLPPGLSPRCAEAARPLVAAAPLAAGLGSGGDGGVTIWELPALPCGVRNPAPRILASPAASVSTATREARAGFCNAAM